MKRGLTLLLFVFNMIHLEALMMHQSVIGGEWKEENVVPFDELMISWNGPRPLNGQYLFYVSVKVNDWSPWLLYASWGNEGQASYHSTTKEAPVRVYQDATEVLEGNKGTGFQIKVVAEGNASAEQLWALHVYTNGDQGSEARQLISYAMPIQLPVAGLSQMTLNDPRYDRLCSPTSTTAVVRYLSNSGGLDPIHFAQHIWDRGFDIFGNWVLNVAEASVQLGPKWNCWVERLSGFDDIYQRLQQGTPVITSVRGPLPGSAEPYAKGHLMAVIGFDPIGQKVLCMDPAFPSDDKTHVAYDLADFLQAWSRRGRVAYIFTPCPQGPI